MKFITFKFKSLLLFGFCANVEIFVPQFQSLDCVVCSFVHSFCFIAVFGLFLYLNDLSNTIYKSINLFITYNLGLGCFFLFVIIGIFRMRERKNINSQYQNKNSEIRKETESETKREIK